MSVDSSKQKAKTHLKQLKGWQFCMGNISASTLISQNRSLGVLVDFQSEFGAVVYLKNVF